MQTLIAEIQKCDICTTQTYYVHTGNTGRWCEGDTGASKTKKSFKTFKNEYQAKKGKKERRVGEKIYS